MAWIKTVSEEEATGYVANVYKARAKAGKEVPNMFKAHSLLPMALRSMTTFYNGVMHGDGELSLKEREMIALTVSMINKCKY